MENKNIQGFESNGYIPKVAVPNQLSDLNDGDTVVAKTNNANKVYATDNSGNQTTLPYSQGISDGASIVQRDANGRIATQTPASNTDAANKSYVDTVFDGSQKALAYSDYASMITAFNDFDNDAYKVGQNVYIRTLNVPDLWVYSVESSSVTYTYVDDATFIAGLTTDGYVQVGYYKLAQLETQTASISNVTAGDIDSETATIGQVLTADGSGGASWNTNNGSTYYAHFVTGQMFTGYSFMCYAITKDSTAFDSTTFFNYIVNNNLTVPCLPRFPMSAGLTSVNYLEPLYLYKYSNTQVGMVYDSVSFATDGSQTAPYNRSLFNITYAGSGTFTVNSDIVSQIM